MTRCPYCRQPAPTVQRGLAWFCTSCGRERTPLTAPSVTNAGKPAKYGGCALRAMGSAVLALGMGAAAIVFGLLYGVFPESAAAWIVSTPIALITAIVGGMLLFGGRKLRRSGEERALTTQRDGIYAVAASQGGVVKARHVAKRLGIGLEEADAALTQLAKESSDEVSLEVDDDGEIYYVVRRFAPPGARIATPPPAKTRIAAATTSNARVASSRERDALTQEAEQELDAMLEADRAGHRAKR